MRNIVLYFFSWRSWSWLKFFLNIGTRPSSLKWKVQISNQSCKTATITMIIARNKLRIGKCTIVRVKSRNTNIIAKLKMEKGTSTRGIEPATVTFLASDSSGFIFPVFPLSSALVSGRMARGPWGSSVVHFLFIRNLSEKNLPEWGLSDPLPSTNPLSYWAIANINVKIGFYISPQTLDQNWSALVSLKQRCLTT